MLPSSFNDVQNFFFFFEMASSENIMSQQKTNISKEKKNGERKSFYDYGKVSSSPKRRMYTSIGSLENCFDTTF